MRANSKLQRCFSCGSVVWRQTVAPVQGAESFSTFRWRGSNSPLRRSVLELTSRKQVNSHVRRERRHTIGAASGLANRPMSYVTTSKSMHMHWSQRPMMTHVANRKQQRTSGRTAHRATTCNRIALQASFRTQQNFKPFWASFGELCRNDF